MKKHTLILLFLSLSVISAQAQTMKIMKGGATVAEYDASQFDEIIFSPAATLSEEVSGDYSSHRVVTLPAMASMGVLVEDTVTLSIAAEGEDTVAVTMPECAYSMAGTDYLIPAVTINGVTLSKNGTAITFSGSYNGEDPASGKAIEATFAGSIDGEGAFSFEEDLKYGTMPFALHFVYTNPAE